MMLQKKLVTPAGDRHTSCTDCAHIVLSHAVFDSRALDDDSLGRGNAVPLIVIENDPVVGIGVGSTFSTDSAGTTGRDFDMLLIPTLITPLDSGPWPLMPFAMPVA